MDEEAQAPDRTTPARLPTADALDDGPARRRCGGWLRQGARALAFRAPQWEGLQARPWTLAVLLLAGYLIAFVGQRLTLGGSPQPHWAGFLSGWAGVAASAWLCWIVARSCAAPTSAAAQPATLFALVYSVSVVFNLAFFAALVPLRLANGPIDDWHPTLQWAAWLLPVAWVVAAQAWLLWRVAGSRRARAAATVLMPLLLVLHAYLAPTAFWWPDRADDDAGPDTHAGLALTDEVVDAQPALLAQALAAVQPPRRGRANVYGLTYAPYASEDVFMRESAVVARTLRERFGADGRMVELVVNPATVATLPWATPLNLRKAIDRIAAVMDRERDILFLHLTSHGGADGELASDTAPLQTEPMTPALLKRWLDDAGVRWRVISVSACYSGSWIAPLAGDGTLVMTAADADHTSYGCGKRSELTFFGRAMYVDALRQTRDFEAAHAQARQLIDAREQEAGKSDGYSNPQLAMGAGIRPVLKQLADELASAP